MNDIKVSLDTNIWIFGITATDPFCRKILTSLRSLNVVIPDQVRAELERNFSSQTMRSFYQFVLESGTDIDFRKVPHERITEFEAKGLKKGDAEIGAYCEWQMITILVSDNRDFLRGLAPEHYFRVMNPLEFCEHAGL